MVSDTANEGKLVLTDRRLLYTTTDREKITSSIVLNNILSIDVTEKRESFQLTKTPCLLIKYKDGNRSKSITFTVPSALVASGNPILLMGEKRYENPYTAEPFAALIKGRRVASSVP